MLTIIFKEIDSEKIEELLNKYIIMLFKENGAALRGIVLFPLEKIIDGQEISIKLKTIGQEFSSAKISIMDGEKVRRKRIKVED